jgi:hypothetical protein
VLPSWHNLPGNIVASGTATKLQQATIPTQNLRPIIGLDDDTLAFYMDASQPDLAVGVWDDATKNPVQIMYGGFGKHPRMTQMKQFYSNTAFYVDARLKFPSIKVFTDTTRAANLVAFGIQPIPASSTQVPTGALPPPDGGALDSSLLTLGVCGAGILFGLFVARRGKHAPGKAHRL